MAQSLLPWLTRYQKGVPCAKSHLRGADSRHSSCRSGRDGRARRWPSIGFGRSRMVDGRRFCVRPDAQFCTVDRFDRRFHRDFANHVSDRRCYGSAESRILYGHGPLALHDVALLREFLRVPRPSNDYGARDLRLGPALRATNEIAAVVRVPRRRIRFKHGDQGGALVHFVA